MSHETVPSDQELADYLLGLLPDDEAERIDELSVVDDDVAARLSGVENDLVDAYVSGTLDRACLQLFERFYLASPRRREKVNVARRLLAAVDRQPIPVAATASGAEPAGSLADRVDALVSARSHHAWLPLAAALLLLTCGVVLFQDVRLRRGLGVARQEGVALNDRATTLAVQLDEQRAANDAMTKELERARTVQPLAAIALVLPPQTRAVGPVAAIAVAPGAGTVPFDLQLEAGEFVVYEAALRDPVTNRIQWRSARLASNSSRRPPTVSVAVPASLLKPQHYSLELSGRTSAGRSEAIGSYAFQIAQR